MSDPKNRTPESTDQNFGEEGGGSNLWQTKEEQGRDEDQVEGGVLDGLQGAPSAGTATAGSPRGADSAMSLGGGDDTGVPERIETETGPEERRSNEKDIGRSDDQA